MCTCLLATARPASCFGAGWICVGQTCPTFRLQTLAGTFSDKASLLVDLNERALAMRTGAPGLGRTCFHFKSQAAR